MSIFSFSHLQFAGSLENLHLPKKKSFRNTDQSFLEKRRQDLDLYLQVIKNTLNLLM